jgi:WD40 repeat protein
VWDVATGKCVSTLRGHKGAIYGVAFSSNGSLATSSEDKTVRLWDWQPGKSRVMVGHTSYVYRCRFSPDGKYLASASHDRTVRIWNVSTGELVQTLQFSKQPVYAMAFSPNGVLLACVGEEHAVQVVDWRTGRIVQTLTGPKDALYAVSWFTAAGKNYLTFGGAETQVTIMETNWAKSEPLDRQ